MICVFIYEAFLLLVGGSADGRGGVEGPCYVYMYIYVVSVSVYLRVVRRPDRRPRRQADGIVLLCRKFYLDLILGMLWLYDIGSMIQL